MNIEKITYKDKNLSLRDFDAVYGFSETINKDKVFNFTVHYIDVSQSADNPHGQEDSLGQKIKKIVIGLLFLAKEKELEFGGQTKII